MRRWVIITVLTLQVAIATGAAGFVHRLLHGDHDDHAGHVVPANGDATHCTIQATLLSPQLATAWVPLLVVLGLFVAFLTEMPPLAVSRSPALRLDCRGPPAVC